MTREEVVADVAAPHACIAPLDELLADAIDDSIQEDAGAAGGVQDEEARRRLGDLLS